jgi:hypothetical protein
MSSITERIKEVWDNIVAGKTKTRASFAIDRGQVLGGDNLGGPFEAEKHYLQIIVNEMFLAHSREWFVKYDPMTFVETSYIYDLNTETLPFVVGPALLKQSEEQAPLGMIFKNTEVSRLHPYQGGALTLTVILNKLKRQNNADRMLKVVESVSKAISPAALSAAYFEVAETVMDGVEMLFNLEETVPVVGLRMTINPSLKDQKLEPSYYVLIDEDEALINQEKKKFWVIGNRLFYGDNQEQAIAYRKNDFVLFSIMQGSTRTDVRTLPFYPLWQTARDFAARTEPHYWNEAKANFNSLKRSLLMSPDLTKPDAERLIDEYFAELKKRREQAVMESNMAPAAPLSADEEMLRGISRELDALDRF